MNPVLKQHIAQASARPILPERAQILDDLVAASQQLLSEGKTPIWHFICTHNSRRSQLSQAWAIAASQYYDLPIVAHSGGVEVTAFHQNAIHALNQAGFKVTRANTKNPKVAVQTNDGLAPELFYSKLYDAPELPKENFIAIMTCDHAAENCPVVVGAIARIPLTYTDPKHADGSTNAAETYHHCSMQIASELLFVCQKLSV